MRKERMTSICMHKVIASGHGAALAGFFPEKVTLETFTPLAMPSFSLKELFDKIHVTWLISHLQSLAEKDRCFYLSCLSLEKQKALEGEFPLTTSYRFFQKEERFFLNLFFKGCFSDTPPPLPLPYLPSNPLAILINATSNQLSKLVFHLGLYDVALEFRKVIQKAALLKMHQTFDKEELSRIREIEKSSSKVHFSEIGLKHWNGDEKLLRSIVYDRGLNRLAKALSQTPDEIFWYIEHIFSVEDAKKICSLKAQVKDQKIFQALMNQVLATWEKVCTTSH